MPQPAYSTGALLRISPSRILFAWIVLVAVSALIFCILYLPPWAALFAGAFIMASATYAARRDALLVAPDSIIELRISQSRLDCRYKRGTWRECQKISPGLSFASRCVSIVAVKSSESLRIRRVILMPDSLSLDESRHLRTWLQWSKAGEIDTHDV